VFPLRSGSPIARNIVQCDLYWEEEPALPGFFPQFKSLQKNALRFFEVHLRTG
jgi:hypothetical protein